jgi:hypothetical protein
MTKKKWLLRSEVTVFSLNFPPFLLSTYSPLGLNAIHDLLSSALSVETNSGCVLLMSKL